MALSTALDMCSVTISTTSGAADLGILSLETAVSWSAATTCTLRATQLFAMNTEHGGIHPSLSNSSPSTGFQAVVISTSAHGGGQAGVIISGFPSTISTVGGDISITASNGIEMEGIVSSTGGGNISILTDQFTAQAQGIFFFNMTVSTTTGNIQIGGGGPVGIDFQTGTISSTSGNISMSGNGTSGAGILLESSSNFVTTGTLTFGGSLTSPDAGMPVTVTGCTGTTGLSLSQVIGVTVSTGGNFVVQDCQGSSGPGFQVNNFTISAAGNFVGTQNITGTSQGCQLTTGHISAASIAITGSCTGGGSGINIDSASTLNSVGTMTLSGASTSGFALSFGGNLTTHGNSVSITGTTQLTAGITIDSTNSGGSPAGGNISFVGNGTTIAGSGTRSLTLTAGTAGAIEFDGAVGSPTSLSSLSAQAGGGILIGANQTAAGTMTYTGPVVLLGDAVITNSGGGGTSFSSTINGASALTFSVGNISFSGAVGNTIPLRSINVQSSGTITVNADQTVSSGTMTYSAPVTLTSSPNFRSGGALSFLSTISGNFNLGITSVGSSVSVTSGITLSGVGASPGGNLTVVAGGSATFGGNIISTSGTGSAGNISISAGGSLSVQQIIAYKDPEWLDNLFAFSRYMPFTPL